MGGNRRWKPKTKKVRHKKNNSVLTRSKKGGNPITLGGAYKAVNAVNINDFKYIQLPPEFKTN
jgi:hypothetical protein